MKLLIIEDEEDLVSALAMGFKKYGYAVDTATDGMEGLELSYVNQYDLIVLDLNLPSIDGLAVLSEIRKKDKDCKILILSARIAVPQRIQGLDMGANDYMVKPFDFGELEARVRSLLRRQFTQNDVLLGKENLVVDTAAKRAYTKDNRFIELSPKEFAILEYLMLHMGMAISAETLIEHIWHSDCDYFTGSVKVHVSNLRKKLQSACGGEFIRNIRGSGYMIDDERG